MLFSFACYFLLYIFLSGISCSNELNKLTKQVAAVIALIAANIYSKMLMTAGGAGVNGINKPLYGTS